MYICSRQGGPRVALNGDHFFLGVFDSLSRDVLDDVTRCHGTSPFSLSNVFYCAVDTVEHTRGLFSSDNN